MDRERNYVNMQVNPCKMCMPMGASQALKGFANTMNIIHGSQGCSTYIRRHMAAHYNEPVDIASSSLSEEGTVYGGSKNLKLGIKNMVGMYHPEIVGVLTTCLAETIGDDINRIVKEVRESGDYDDVDIIPIPTPGYGGSQSEGYFAAIKGILKYYGEKYLAGEYEYLSEDLKERDYEELGLDREIPYKAKGYINVIVSNATCEDIRELKRISGILGVDFLILPDISDVFDAPYEPNYNKLNGDGLSREQIPMAFEALATIELGHLVADMYSPAKYLYETFDIPMYRLPLPIGIHHMDAFVETVASVMEMEVPGELVKERGRLLDGMIDSHKHSALGKVAIFGDMDLVYGISGLLAENGMDVMVCATGSKTKRFKEGIESIMDKYSCDPVVMQDSDFETIREVIHERGVNIMVGTSDGKFIWEKDGIDLVRVGFPVHDHIGAQRKLRFGYKGSIRLLDEVVNKLLDQKHRGYKDRMIDNYYKEVTKRMEEPIWQ